MPPPFATDAVLSVLAALRDHPITAPACALPILGVGPSAATGSNSPISTLLDVVSRNVERYGHLLRQSVRDFDWVLEQTARHVHRASSADAEVRAVHGDLCPPNILLGPDRTVSAVIDWGFLSHFGNAAFDASIACGSYNLYGKHYRENDNFLMSECVDRHGFDHHRLLVYRALYAILTSNAYSEEATDGHYGWCVGALNRDDVRAALATAPPS